MISIIKDIANFLFPQYCICCGERLSKQEKHICISCLANLPRTNSHICSGLPPEQLFWGKIPIERALCFFFHESTGIKQIIWSLKYNNQPDIGRYIAHIFAEEIKDYGIFDNIDIIIPVPLSWRKRIKRGYNQSDYIAKGISEVTGIPVITNAVKKIKHTESQTNFDNFQRQENVKGIFSVVNPKLIEGKHILLVDDVLTTGATLCSLGNTISQAANVKISVLTLALAGQLKGVPFEKADSKSK